MTMRAPHQQPIFAAKPGLVARFAPGAITLAERTIPEPFTEARVVPFCIFAAGKRAFEVRVRGVKTLQEAKTAIYADLPLHEHGWTFAEMKVRQLRTVPHGTIFRVERR